MEGPHPSKFPICVAEGHVPMKVPVFSSALASIQLPYRLPRVRQTSTGKEVAFVLNACARCGLAYIVSA